GSGRGPEKLRSNFWGCVRRRRRRTTEGVPTGGPPLVARPLAAVQYAGQFFSCQFRQVAEIVDLQFLAAPVLSKEASQRRDPPRRTTMSNSIRNFARTLTLTVATLLGTSSIALASEPASADATAQ